MEKLLETIHGAVAPEATDERKRAGAAACRTILSALEAKAGETMIPAARPADPIASIVAMLRGVPGDQLLDLAIAKLRSIVPAEQGAVTVNRLNVPLVAVPQLGRKP